MRTFLILLIAVMCMPLVQPKVSLVSIISEAASSALSLFTTIIDLYTSTEKNDLAQITQEISDLKHTFRTGLDSLLVKVDKSTYQTTLTRYIDKIESCEKDYFNYIANSSDAARRHLEKCSDIIISVRSLAKYLSGKKIIDSRPFFDLYKDKEGVCNGSAIETSSKILFTDYTIGCTIAITIETIENGHSTSLRAGECRDTMVEIINYMKRLYRDCAQSSCKTIHSFPQMLFIESPPTSSRDFHVQLSKMYPWFNFLIFKLSKGAKATAGGNFSIGHDDGDWTNGYKYDMFFFDSNISITKKSRNYSLAITVEKESHFDHYFGNSNMTKIDFDGLSFKMFIGYAPENNEFCNGTMDRTGTGTGTGTGTANALFPESFFVFVLTCAMIT